jgi:hypothetical protein
MKINWEIPDKYEIKFWPDKSLWTPLQKMVSHLGQFQMANLIRENKPLLDDQKEDLIG